MAVEDTIFNGLTKEDENATTEVLANLLRGTKCVREIILKEVDLLKAHGVEEKHG